VLADHAGWSLADTVFTRTVTSACGHVTFQLDRAPGDRAGHLSIAARTSNRAPARWTASMGGQFPVEFLTSLTTFLTAELLRNPDHVLYGLAENPSLFELADYDSKDWLCRTDRDVAEWHTRRQGARVSVVSRLPESTAPPLAGQDDIRMLFATTVPGKEEQPDLLWWAAFSHGTPTAVMGTLLNDVLTPEPLIRPPGPLVRPDLVPLLTARPVPTAPPPPTSPLPSAQRPDTGNQGQGR
jgi:hypothetical protein